MSRVEVIARTERRRSYTDEQRAEVLAEAARPGAVVAQVARRYGIAESLIYEWRKRRRPAEVQATEPLRIVPYGTVAGPQPSMADATPAVSAQMLDPVSATSRCKTVRNRSDAPGSSSTGSGLGAIQVDLPTGVRLLVDSYVNEKALARVLRALRDAS